tara:strand:+ start:579 stop:878 length:300 start_codon:yes stop_codon:yes gene_type:complete
MNNKNSRTNALPGLRKKNGPTSNPSVSDSVNRGKINSNIRILSDKEVKEKNTDGHGNKLKKYVPGVDGPKVIGGAVPFGGGRILGGLRGVYNLGKKLLK